MITPPASFTPQAPTACRCAQQPATAVAQAAPAAEKAATGAPAHSNAPSGNVESQSSPAAGLREEPLQELTLEVMDSIAKVDRREWDEIATAGGEVNPFLLWGFLHALEASRSAVRLQTF